MEWISVRDRPPKHMEVVRVFIENPYFGSSERTKPAVYLHFVGMEDGEFYDSGEQIHLDFVTRWMPLPKPPEEKQ